MSLSEGRVYNFSAGPAMLPEPVLKQAAAEMLNYQGSGMSVMEMSHRTPTYENLIATVEKDLRTLLNIPDTYAVLLLEGGATHQFSSVPLNLLGEKKVADYFVTGTWSKKAAQEAARYCKVNTIVDPGKYNRVPPKAEWKPFSPDAAYVYYCDNETIEGVEFPAIPDTGSIPLVVDMSSNFLSKRLDVTKYGMIYACAQKNFGPAGLTVVVIRKDLLAIPPHPACPLIMQNKLQAENKSMYNTPATYNVYIAGLVFKWIMSLGGLGAMEEINVRKCKKLYDYIDASGYWVNPVQPDCRSRMNVPFACKDAKLEKAFLEQAAKDGLVTLAGHRSVGGFRASIYNAMPESGIDRLIAFMKKFAEANPNK